MGKARGSLRRVAPRGPWRYEGPLVVLVGMLGAAIPGLVRPLAVLQIMLIQGIFINLILAAFNLMPIPPLDGSHVFKYLLPPSWAIAYQRLASVGLLLLFAVLSCGAATGASPSTCTARSARCGSTRAPAKSSA